MDVRLHVLRSYLILLLQVLIVFATEEVITCCFRIRIYVGAIARVVPIEVTVQVSILKELSNMFVSVKST